MLKGFFSFLFLKTFHNLPNSGVASVLPPPSRLAYKIPCKKRAFLFLARIVFVLFCLFFVVLFLM